MPKRYSLSNYLQQTRREFINESFVKIEKNTKKRELKESKSPVIRTAKRLTRHYLKETNDPKYISKKVIADLKEQDYSVDSNIIRGLVYESVIPSREGSNYKRLSLQEQAAYKSSLYKIKRNYTEDNILEHFAKITSDVSSSFGVDPVKVFEALVRDNHQFTKFDADQAVRQAMEELENEFDIKTAPAHAALKQAIRDKMAKSQGTEGEQEPERISEYDEYEDTEMTWYNEATEEMLDRIRRGERSIDVINDLSRRYARTHTNNHEAFEFAYDALSKRAWEHGLNETSHTKSRRAKEEDLEKDMQVYHPVYGTGYVLRNMKDGVLVDFGKGHGKKYLEKNNIQIQEAEYKGREVELNDPFRNSGSGGKFAVYVTVPKKKNKVKRVEFGDKDMEIKRDDPKARKSFRARHKCDKKTFSKDRHKAGYWSCRFWRSGETVSDLLKG